MTETKSILFVCTGNTCRSPMAEALFKSAVAGQSHITASSAGVLASDGNRASLETLEILRERNIDFAGFRSRSVTREMLARASHVFAMTESHLAALEERFPDYSDKYHLLGEFAPETTGSRPSYDVPDPIGLGKDAYEDVACVFDEAIPSIIAYVRSGA